MGVQIIIRGPPYHRGPHYRWREALMPRCGGLDAIHWFHFAGPGLVRAGQDKW